MSSTGFDQVSEKLDSAQLDVFWNFIHNRQQIWFRRHILKENPPWTEDEILRNYRFTNVYRILDPGTQYAIEDILDTSESRRSKLFNDIIYRILGRRETHMSVGFLQLNSFSSEEIERKLRIVDEEKSHSVFTGAYTVAPYHQYEGRDKIENISHLARDIFSIIDDLLKNVETSADFQECYNALKIAPGLGRFLAYQVAVDLTYPLECRDGRSFVPHSANKWARAGPGAQKGISIIRCSDCISQLDTMSYLSHNQKEEFSKRNIEFNFLSSPSGEDIQLSMADIQNCLCEYSKYIRINDNPSAARRKFRDDVTQASPYHVSSKVIPNMAD